MKKINLIAPILGVATIAPTAALVSCASKATTFSKIIHQLDNGVMVGELLSNIDLVVDKEYHFIFDLANVDDKYNVPYYFDVTDANCQTSYSRMKTVTISYAGKTLVKDTDYFIDGEEKPGETTYVQFKNDFITNTYQKNPKKQFEIYVVFSSINKSKADNISITCYEY